MYVWFVGSTLYFHCCFESREAKFTFANNSIYSTPSAGVAVREHVVDVNFVGTSSSVLRCCHVVLVRSAKILSACELIGEELQDHFSYISSF